MNRTLNTLGQYVTYVCMALTSLRCPPLDAAIIMIGALALMLLSFQDAMMRMAATYNAALSMVRDRCRDEIAARDAMIQELTRLLEERKKHE